MDTSEASPESTQSCPGEGYLAFCTSAFECAPFAAASLHCQQLVKAPLGALLDIKW